MLPDVIERTRALRQADIALNSTCSICELYVCNMENVTNVSKIKLFVQNSWALEKKNVPHSSPLTFQVEASK